MRYGMNKERAGSDYLASCLALLHSMAWFIA